MYWQILNGDKKGVIMNDTELFSIMVNNLKDLVDSDTVIGKEITAPNNSLIIPISKVSVGIVSASGESEESKLKKGLRQAGGGGAGGSVTPLGFLVLNESSTRFINVDKEESGKWSNLINSAMDLFKTEK